MGSGSLYCCYVCDAEGKWAIERRGDVATTWACASHLDEACEALQRDDTVTKVTVWLRTKAREWAEISDMLRKVEADG